MYMSGSNYRTIILKSLLFYVYFCRFFSLNLILCKKDIKLRFNLILQCYKSNQVYKYFLNIYINFYQFLNTGINIFYGSLCQKV